jgi:hypothetical protein
MEKKRRFVSTTDEEIEQKRFFSVNTLYWPVENSIPKNNDADDR